MDIKQLNEELKKLLEEQLYIIYDDEWEDNSPLNEEGVIKFAVEHFWDREDEFTSLEDFKQFIGREDGTDNPYKEDGTYNLCKYAVTDESKKLFAITQKIRNNQEITFEESVKLLKEMDFYVRKS